MQLEGTDSFYPHDAMLMPDAGTGYDPVSLSVCLSDRSRCSITRDEQIAFLPGGTLS